MGLTTACVVVTSTIVGWALAFALPLAAREPQPLTRTEKPRATTASAAKIFLSFIIISGAYTAQQYLGEVPRGLLVRNVQNAALLVPQNVVQRVMYQHS